MTDEPSIEKETARDSAERSKLEGTCPACAAAWGSAVAEAQYVYAIGSLAPRVPRLSLEKELMQASSATAAGLTDRQALIGALRKPELRYIAREVCWVFSIHSIPTYIVTPREPSQLDLMLEAAASTEGRRLTVLIGRLGPVAPPSMCNGLSVPLVASDHLYTFGEGELISAVPLPPDVKKESFREAVKEVLSRVLDQVDNAGATDEHRALNYLCVRYPGLYAVAAQRYLSNSGLTSLEVVRSQLSGVRRIVAVVATFTHRQTGVGERLFARVDVTETYPFLVSPFSPFFEGP